MRTEVLGQRVEWGFQNKATKISPRAANGGKNKKKTRGNVEEKLGMQAISSAKKVDDLTGRRPLPRTFGKKKN